MLQKVSRNSIGFQTKSGTCSLNAFAFATFKTAALEIGSSANHEKTVSEILSTTKQQQKEYQGRIEKPRRNVKPNENKKAQQIFGALFLVAYRESTTRK